MILIVDDHLDTCRPLTRLLERAGHSVECVHQGHDALALASEVRPKCVVLDVMMPGLTGFDVLKALRARRATADVPVLMYSAHATEADRQRAAVLGADDFLVKGRVEWAELLARIEALAARGDRAAAGEGSGVGQGEARPVA